MLSDSVNIVFVISFFVFLLFFFYLFSFLFFSVFDTQVKLLPYVLLSSSVVPTPPNFVLVVSVFPYGVN